ncbi:MAG: hypothetical protein ACI4UV_02160 [Victivallales bacterium]
MTLNIGGALERISPDNIREESGKDRTIRMYAARNAHVTSTLTVSNTTDRVLGFRLLKAGKDAGCFKIERLYLFDGAADHPREIGEGDLIEIGRRQSIGFLVTSQTAGLRAGEYRAEISMVPNDGALPVVKAPLELKVYDYSLPGQMPISIYMWDYGHSRDPKIRNLLLDIRVNIFQVAFWNRQEAEELKFLEPVIRSLLEKPGKGNFQLLIETAHIRQAKGKWTEQDDCWLDKLISVLKDYGLEYRDWLLHVYDESLSEEHLAVLKRIREHDPEVRIFTDALVRDPKVMERFEPYVSVWCPLAGLLFDPAYEKGMGVLRTSHIPIWCYSCDSSPSHSLNQYRLQGWIVFLAGIQGNCFWSIQPSAYRNELSKPNFGITYGSWEYGLVSSRRLVQWREGLEDYLLLHAVAESGRKELARQAAREVVRNPSILEQWRRRLLESLK